MSDAPARSLIGMILNDPTKLLYAKQIGISQSNFTDPRLREIWAAIESQDVQDPNFFSGVVMRLVDMSRPIAVELSTNAPIGQNMEFYADEVVHSQAALLAAREFGKISRELIDRKDFDPVSIVASRCHDSAVQLLSSAVKLSKKETTHERMGDYIEILENRAKLYLGGELPAISSGFSNLDAYFSGWRNGSLHILAARPRIGKTTMAMSFLSACSRQGKNCAFFSTEMSPDDLFDKLMSHEARVNYLHILSGGFDEDAIDRIHHATERLLKSTAIAFPDLKTKTIEEIEAKCRLMKMKGELDFVVIENIQQLDTVYRHRSQYEKVSAVTMRLKSLARDLQIPVLGLAHINREADKMGETKPKLAHLKDSSSIENDADVVLLMYRENEEKQGAVSIRVAKNRRGEEGDIHFRVNFAQNTFEVV